MAKIIKKNLPQLLKETKWLPILTFFFGVLIGPSALWLYQNKSLKLETSKHIVELNRDIKDLFFKFIELTKELIDTSEPYMSLKDYLDREMPKILTLKTTASKKEEYRKNYKDFQNIKAKRREIKIGLKFLAENFNKLEKKLASLENRKPRTLPTEFKTPGPVKGFSVTTTP